INPPPDPGSVRPLRDFKGLFAGGTVSGDNRRVKISFDVQQKGDQISGTYGCAPGNATCRNQMLKGWVSGNVDARGIRVSLQDGSWCLYNLGVFYVNEGEGDYSCYNGGMLVEHGVFSLKRVEPD
ncbi:MAG: hypothetical protein ACREQC_15220, partial [Candidatus Binataceae bacterium]